MSSYIIMRYLGHELPSTYRNLVFSKWLRSLRYGNETLRLVAPDAYFSYYHTRIEYILSAPECVVHLALLSDDHDICLGWAVTRGNSIVDYVHVHKDYRRNGIAKSLFPASFKPETITHITKSVLPIWEQLNVKFNPFL